MSLETLNEMKQGLLINIQEAEIARTGKLRLPKLRENLQKVEQDIIMLAHHDPSVNAIIINEESH